MRFRCAVSMLLVLYTEKDMSKFLYSLSAGRYQDAKKQDPQVLLQILICSSKLEYVGLMLLHIFEEFFCFGPIFNAPVFKIPFIHV